jgi:hypothetical protein
MKASSPFNLLRQNRRRIQRMSYSTILYSLDKMISQLDKMESLVSEIESLFDSDNSTSIKVLDLRTELSDIKTQLAGSLAHDKNRYGYDSNESET